MNLSGADASLQTAVGEGKTEEVKNNYNEGGKHFNLNSLPPGFKFDPTDSEIIIFYLRKKIDHQPLPPNKIIEVNLYAYDPDELAARYDSSGKDEWFYFTPRDRKFRNGHRPNRSVGDGWWKATGADKEIIFEDRTVGYRKALVFYRGSIQNGVKTNWIMHEYRVSELPEPPRRSGVNDMRLDDCVLCRVYRSKRSRHECRLDESRSSSSKIPRLGINPNPNEANNPREEHYYYNSNQVPLQTQRPQPIPHQTIHYIGNEFGGQGLDNFDIMNRASGSSFGNIPDLDATNDFGNVPGFDSTDYGNSGLYPMIVYGNDAAPMSSHMNGNVLGFDSTDYGNSGLYPMIDYGSDAAPMSSDMNGNVPGFDSTDYGNSGLYPMIDYGYDVASNGNVPGFDSTDYGNSDLYPMIDYGNDAAPTSSNMNGNYGHGLVPGRSNNQ